MKLLPLLVKIKLLARLLNLPAIGEAEVLLITVNTVPVGNVPVPGSIKVNVAPLSSAAWTPGTPPNAVRVSSPNVTVRTLPDEFLPRVYVYV